jgi:hypothetical protein
MKSNKFAEVILCNFQQNTEEAVPYFKSLGLILIIAFIGFYFFNIFVDPTVSENFYLRLLIGSFGVLLMSYRHWPKFLLNISPFLFHFILLISFPFFFILMLFNNPTSDLWHINGLVGLVLLSFFVDWLPFIIISLIGVTLAGLVTSNSILDSNLIGVFGFMKSSN